MRLEVVTPNGQVLEVEASSVTAPGFHGEFGVLPGHRAALVMLGGGAIRYEGASSGHVYVRGGVAQISGDTMLVLADEATKPDNVDRERAERLLEQAARVLEEVEFLDETTRHRVSTDQAYSEALLKVAGH